mgnify:CR=1 FL=1
MPLPTIPSGNVASALPTGYNIDNSCRFNTGDSAELSISPSSSSNRKTWTFSTWCKRTTLGSNNYLLDAYEFPDQVYLQ